MTLFARAAPEEAAVPAGPRPLVLRRGGRGDAVAALSRVTARPVTLQGFERRGGNVRRPVVLVVIVGVLVVTLVAGVISGVLITAAETAKPSAAPAVEATWPTPAAIAWGACADKQLQAARAQCATVAVPMDWSAPRNGKTVRLAISRVQHSATPYAGRDADEPGRPRRQRAGPVDDRCAGAGPASAPGTTGSASTPAASAPPGPRLSCDPDYANGPRPAYTPATAANIQAWLKRSDRLRGGVRREERRAARAHDDPRLRERHGVPADRARREDDQLLRLLVRHLPRAGLRDALPDAASPAWCSTPPSTRRGSGTARTSTRTSRSRPRSTRGSPGSRSTTPSTTSGPRSRRCRPRYDRSPPRSPPHPAGGRLGSAELADTLLYAGYGQSVWPGLGTAFARAAQGSTAMLEQYWLGLNETTDDNGYAAYLAVECTDAVWPGEWSTWAADAEAGRGEGAVRDVGQHLVQRAVPHLAGEGGHPGRRDRRARSAPILMIDETLDAATPYSRQPRRPEAVPEGPAARRARRHDARRLAERQRLRRRHGRGLPEGRHAAGAEGGRGPGRDLRAAADADALPGPGRRRRPRDARPSS